MDNESTSRLKFDRRLATRRGWVEPEELEQELASLPDASDKIQEPGEEPEPRPAPSIPSTPGHETGSDGGMPDA